MRYFLNLFAFLVLSGCTSSIVEDHPVTVKVPVATPCASARPSKPVPLRDKVENWGTLDVRQKAAYVGKQGLEWQTYGELLDAATAACPEGVE